MRVGTEVAEVHGEQHLEAVTLVNVHTGEKETLSSNALFIFIGAQPHTDWCNLVVARDAYGFILTGPDTIRDGRRPVGWRPNRDPFLLEASVPGIFVAGDVRHGSVKRVASAVGEGAIAVEMIHQYLNTV